MVENVTGTSDVCLGSWKTIYKDPSKPELGIERTECDGILNEDVPNNFEGDFLTYNLNLGWSYNTLNRPISPTNGMSHRVNAEIALPGSDVEFQKVTYDAQAYFPLGKDFVLRGYGKLGFGNDLPFYKNFYAGGYGWVGRVMTTVPSGPKYQA